MKNKISKIAIVICIIAMAATYIWWENGTNFETLSEQKYKSVYSDSIIYYQVVGDSVQVLKEGEYQIKSYKLLK